jgi:cell cycle sensor histidine kinase DivJ
VGLHGGSIVIESSPDSGTCVTVRLPLDCSNPRPENILAKIETVFRHGVTPGRDVANEDAAVRKIA